MIKKLVGLIACGALLLAAIASGVAAAGVTTSDVTTSGVTTSDNSKQTPRLRCAAVSGIEYSTIGGFELPSDAEPVNDSVKPPQAVGTRGTSIIGVGTSSSFRTSIPVGTERVTVAYELDADGGGVSKDDCLALGVYISSNGTLDGERASLLFSLTDEDGKSFSVRTSVRVDEPYIVYLDSSEPDAGALVGLSLAIGFEDTQRSYTLITSMPTLTESRELSWLREHGIVSVSSAGGNVELDDELTVGTDEGDVILSAIFEDTVGEDSSRSAFVTLDCSSGDGSVAAVSAGAGSTELTHAVSASSVQLALRATCFEHGELRMSFKSAVGDKLSFSDIGCVLADTVSDSGGSFTSLVCTDDVISATGRISPDIVSEYHGSYIGLYTESVTSPSEPELLVKARMTSRFSFSASTAELPHAHSDNTFFVGVVSEAGPVRITDSRFAAAHTARRSLDGIIGLYGADPISVYESAAQYMLVDVDLSRLITDASASSTTVSRGGYIYGIDTKYLSELDYDMNFYSSIGVSVYMRLICTDGLFSAARQSESELTYFDDGADEVVARASSSEALCIYPAAASFLSRRYSSISSFVISSGANSTRLTGISDGTAWDGAASVAMIARLVYGASVKYLPEITLTVPLVTESDELYASPELFCAMFGSVLNDVGEIPWEVMFVARTSADTVRFENIKNTAHLNSACAPTYLAALYRLDDSGADSMADYEAFCELCLGGSVRAAFLDVSSCESALSRESYSRLKSSKASRSVELYEREAVDVSRLDEISITGSAKLWDFSASYSTGGWRAGYGMTCVVSASGASVGGARRLWCRTDADCPAGMLLVSLEQPLDPADVQLAEFVFSLEGEDVQLVFVFGNDSSRAEFSLEDMSSFELDGELHALCELSACEQLGKISYIGIIVYSPSAAELSMSSVSAHSLTLDSDSVASLVAAADDGEPAELPKAEYIVAGGAAAIVVLALSVRTVVVLSRRDAENSRREAERRRRKF